MTRILLAFLLLVAATMSVAGPGGFTRTTTTAVSCAPDPVDIYATGTCTVTVTEVNTGGPQGGPVGTVSFSSSGSGTFTPAACTLVDQGGGSSSCQISYTPSAYNGGSHTITAGYSGGSDPTLGPGVIWQASSGNTALGVAFPPVSIASITPNQGVRGTDVDVTVTGNGFVAGSTTLALGADITVSGLTVTGPTELLATLSIEFAAALGLRNVTVTNPAPGGSSATLTNGFEVRNPVPDITTLSPSAVEEGHGAVMVTISGDNFVNDSIAYFNGTARGTTFVSSTELLMSLDAADTSVTGDYDVHVNNPAPGGGDSNAAVFSVVLSGGSFDVVESGQDVDGRLFTKLAGVAFGVDVLATDVGRTAINTSFAGDVLIELLDAADDADPLDANGCRASWSVVQNLGTHSFSGGDNGRVNLAFSRGDAVRIARFRISHPAAGAPTHIGCSSDAFSIRPQVLVLATGLNNAGTGGAPVHVAGDAFSMSATGIAGYDGTPQIDAALLSAHAGAPATGTLTGAFPAANPADGESSFASFSYDEVGNFTLDTTGVHDSSFTAIDQPNDCTDDFSNSVVSGQYGCHFGNIDPLTVGRFVPAYFETTLVEGCDADGFSYSGQPFEVTVRARNAAGGLTQNFNYSATPSENFAKEVTLSDKGDASRFDSPDNIVLADYFANGTATVSNVVYRFDDPETEYTVIDVRAIDTDSVSSVGHLEGTTEVRSGRLAMENASALTSDNGIMNVIVQSWQEVTPGVHEWATHADDQACTVLTTGDFSLDAASYTGNLNPGDTTIINFNYAAGEGTLALSAPGAGNYGSVDVNVGADDWLFFDWEGNGPEAPHGTMRFFEVFSTEPGFIFREEIIN